MFVILRQNREDAAKLTHLELFLWLQTRHINNQFHNYKKINIKDTNQAKREAEENYSTEAHIPRA